MEITSIKTYSDANGNTIEFTGDTPIPVKRIYFKGKNNNLKIHPKVNITHLDIGFYCNNAYVELGASGNIKATMQIGEDSRVIIGNHVYFTASSYISVAEGTSITINDNCMIAPGTRFRTNDAHPIFDIESGLRVNPSKNITIEKHVWLCENVTVLKGSIIKEGSVIAMNSTVCGYIPNNCITAGVPAKVVKKNIAWEYPHLCYTEQYYKNDSSCVKKSVYWNLTQELE